MGVAGWNWGKAELDGANLTFRVGEKPAFHVPLPDVTQVCGEGFGCGVAGVFVLHCGMPIL